MLAPPIIFSEPPPLLRYIDVMEALISHITTLDQPTAPGILCVRNSLKHLDDEASGIIIQRIVGILANDFDDAIMNERTRMLVQDGASRLYQDVLDQEFCCTSDGRKIIGLEAAIKSGGIAISKIVGMSPRETIKISVSRGAT